MLLKVYRSQVFQQSCFDNLIIIIITIINILFHNIMTKYAEMIISVTDEKVATELHIDTVRLTEAAIVSSADVISAVRTYQFWLHEDTRRILDKHPAAIWKRLTFKMSQGPGLFGRAVTLHYGWGYDGMIVPTTVKQMSALHGYQCHVFGGVFSLSDDQTTINAPFNSARSDVAKANQFMIGGRIVLYFFYEESNLGTTQGAGPVVTFRFEGEFDVYDRN